MAGILAVMCRLTGVRVVCHGQIMALRALVLQQKTRRPLQFEITEPTREAVLAWIAHSQPQASHGEMRLTVIGKHSLAGASGQALLQRKNASGTSGIVRLASLVQFERRNETEIAEVDFDCFVERGCAT